MRTIINSSHRQTSGRWAASSAAITVTAALLALAGCSEDDGSPEVFASTGIAHSIVAEIASDRIEVGQLVPDEASPHTYAPSARELAELADAEEVFYFSDSLEAALPLESAKRRFEIDAHVGPLASTADGDGLDPHVWMDPNRIAAAAPAIAGELARLDPEHAAGYRRRAVAMVDALRQLDRRISAKIATIPPRRRLVVTSHDALGYYLRRYKLRFVGSPFGVAPEAEAAPRSGAELADRIERLRLPAVFAQRGDDPELLRRISGEDVEVIDDLSIEGLGPGDRDYEQMLLSTTDKIVAALAP